MAKLCPHKYYEGPANAGEERLFRFLEVNLPNDYYIVPMVSIPASMPRVASNIGNTTVSWWRHTQFITWKTRTGRAGLRVTTTLGLSTTMSLRTPSRPPVSNPRYWWPT